MNGTERMLARYGALKRIVAECEENVRERKAEQVSFFDSLMKPPGTDGVRVMGGKVSDPTGEAAVLDIVRYHARIDAAKQELRRYQDELDAIARRIRAAGLDGTERRYLELRWVTGLSVGAVAARMGYTERGCCKIKNRITAKLDNEAEGPGLGKGGQGQGAEGNS